MQFNVSLAFKTSEGCRKVIFSVCPHLRGGGGYPVPSLNGGTPSQVQMGGTPSEVWMGGYPPPPSKTGWSNPPPRSEKRAFATRRAVCLLRSSRRTFLFPRFLAQLLRDTGVLVGSDNKNSEKRLYLKDNFV